MNTKQMIDELRNFPTVSEPKFIVLTPFGPIAYKAVEYDQDVDGNPTFLLELTND